MDWPPSAGTLVGFLAAAFVAAMIYIGVRFLRESKAQRLDRAAVREEIGRRAAAKGRRIENGSGEEIWTMHGALPGGEAWTLAYKVGYATSVMSENLSHPDSVHRDWLAGQRLEWRCPTLKRDALAFSFYKRTDRKIRPGEVTFDPSDQLWQRWRLEASDEATARRVFGTAASALLLKLPLRRYRNADIDQRTSITLGTDGLVAVLGLDDLTPELAELWIEAAQAMAPGR